MSREIKFRQFCSDEDHVDYGMHYMKFNGILVRDGDWHIMQYTGLKDKNGVEIYEGDIFKTMGYPFYGDAVGDEALPESERVELNYVAEVLIDVDGVCYDLHVVSDRVRGAACGGNLSLESSSRLLVMGNIYENPELLIS